VNKDEWTCLVWAPDGIEWNGAGVKDRVPEKTFVPQLDRQRLVWIACIAAHETKQSWTADFTLGAQTATRNLLIFVDEQDNLGLGSMPKFRLLSSRRSGMDVTRHWADCVKIRRHPQNRKWKTYRNAAREGTNHGRRRHVQKLVTFGLVVSEIYEWTDRQTNRRTCH